MTQSPTLSRRSAHSDSTLPRKSRQRGADARAGYTFLLPWLLGFIVLTLGPMISSLYLSFTNYNLFDPPKWIGLDNYTTMFQDERFLQSVGVTVGYVVFGTPLKLAAALAVAMLLNSARKGQGFYRSAFYAPSLIGASVSIAIVWKAMFGDSGPVDQGLSFFGINLGGWVGNPSMTMPMFILLTVWQFGAPMVIFLAGLKQIPADLYEAASMDGAGPVRKFFNITWPMLSPVVFFNLLMETIHAFQIFSSAYIISNGEGGPAGSTLFYTLYLYLRGFSDFRMGYASAMAWLLLIVVGILTLIIFRTSKSWVHYSGDAK
ncbi:MULTISPECIES: carbohydrate ABC transporter permease [Micrococcaceae]|uniref:Multiple sugar transport system permease protein n=1 Tax=Pseudarthrobacter siccitolerans TaxID=861266 RepID=A0ABU0PJP1_9MICC|nr:MULTISPECIES: sugar ABC transporter permease [Micrococcaceae]MDQ0674175.1 multiple sugar transport system permease protein [Pseudarthrobacter siccitolerans]MDQ0689651.1 multiple sugar transport system permease protein [Arthrobacter sp. W4I7]